MRALSRQAVALERLLACRAGLALYLRRLMVSPIAAACALSAREARREAKRRRGSGQQSECVFGCAVCGVMQFVRNGRPHTAADTVATLRSALEAGSHALLGCTGEDVAHLQRGFGAAYIASSQFARMAEVMRNPTTGRRRERNDDIALGASATLFVVLSEVGRDAHNSAALLFALDRVVGAMVRALNYWSAEAAGAHTLPQSHHTALAAEKRAVQRGFLALRRARLSARDLELDTYNTVRLVLATVRRAMWPAARAVSAETHGSLGAWVLTEEFMDEEHVPVVVKPHGPGDFRVPLSALSSLPRGALGERVDADGAESVSDATSTTTNSTARSSTGSFSSAWSSSAGSEPPHDEHAIRALEAAFLPHSML